MSAGAYALVVIGFGMQRLVELRYSGRNERRMAERHARTSEAGVSVFRRIALLHLGLFTLPVLERWLRRQGATFPNGSLEEHIAVRASALPNRDAAAGLLR